MFYLSSTSERPFTKYPSVWPNYDISNALVKVNPKGGGGQAYDRVHLTIQGTLTTAILSNTILTLEMVEI